MVPLPAQLRPILMEDASWGFLFEAGVVAAALLLLVIAGLTLVLFRLRLRNRARGRRWSRLEEEWEPLLLEVLHGDAEPEHLASRVSPKDRTFFLGFLVSYAERLKGEERRRVESVAHPHLDALLPELGDPDVERRGFAVRALGVLGLPHYAPQLVERLDDPAPLVRFAAAHGLLDEGRSDFAEEVVRKLDRFGTWAGDAMAGLLAKAGSEVAPLLRITLADPFTTAETAAVAARTLLRMADPHAAHIAVTVLKERSERELVTECLRLLGAVGRKEHAAFVRSFTDHPDFAVRAQAVAALGEIGGEGDVEVLRAAVSDSSQWVQLRAAGGLKRMGRDDVLREIAEGGGEGAVFAREAVGEGVA